MQKKESKQHNTGNFWPKYNYSWIGPPVYTHKKSIPRQTRRATTNTRPRTEGLEDEAYPTPLPLGEDIVAPPTQADAPEAALASVGTACTMVAPGPFRDHPQSAGIVATGPDVPASTGGGQGTFNLRQHQGGKNAQHLRSRPHRDCLRFGSSAGVNTGKGEHLGKSASVALRQGQYMSKPWKLVLVLLLIPNLQRHTLLTTPNQKPPRKNSALLPNPKPWTKAPALQCAPKPLGKYLALSPPPRTTQRTTQGGPST